MTPRASTYELVLDAPDALHDVLVAELDALGATGFVQEPDRLLAYLPANVWTDALRDRVSKVVAPSGVSVASVRAVADENWNAAFEATIQPVAARPFVVKPSWHTLAPEHEGLTVLHIDPKMSFGTGLHESTRLVLGLLPEVVRPGDRVLDAGTGTGVLAIAALKLGAQQAIAFDIDVWAEENAGENFERNAVQERAEVRIGDLDVVPETGFDVVLANIHREVLLGMLAALASKTREGGRLVLAGLLRADAETMRAATAAAGFETLREATENDWWAWAGQKSVFV